MTTSIFNTYTAFAGYQRIAAGPLQMVAVIVKHAMADQPNDSILIFDDSTGCTLDIDTRGSEQEVIARLPPPINNDTPEAEVRGRGRPKLGVIAREVTLLPRHWEWLNTQPGGASVALRKLVDEARRTNMDRDLSRQAKEAAYHFMSAMCGDLAGFEEAARALFANNVPHLQELISTWPKDVSSHITKLINVKKDE